jgi:hypothetical protein
MGYHPTYRGFERGKEYLDTMRRATASKVVWVSSNPATLAWRIHRALVSARKFHVKGYENLRDNWIIKKEISKVIALRKVEVVTVEFTIPEDAFDVVKIINQHPEVESFSFPSVHKDHFEDIHNYSNTNNLVTIMVNDKIIVQRVIS